MRYIPKTSPPSELTEWLAAQQAAGITPRYADFRDKSLLNDALRAEQGHICCYCQQRISRFRQNNQGDAHNEHLIPQRGAHGDSSQELEYTNLYASCSHSAGQKAEKAYCGEAKKDALIAPLIQHPECATLLTYNVQGEILPAGGRFLRHKEYQTHRASLEAHEKSILETIETLNLNATYLVEERKKTITRVISLLLFYKTTPSRITASIDRYNSTNRFYPYINAALHFMHLAQRQQQA